MDIKKILKEEIEKVSREQEIFDFLKSKLDLKSKIVLGKGPGMKVVDIPFPKAGIFHIEVDVNDTFEGVKNMARELVYIKLVETKRLKYINDKLISFDGTQYDISDEKPDLPFEEAVNKMIKKLTNEYWHHMNGLKEGYQHRSFFENVDIEAGDFKSARIVKLYRIENGNIPYDDSRDGVVSHPTIKGQWFTPNIDAVFNYLQKNQKMEGCKLVIVELPLADLEKYHVSNHPIASKMDVENDNYLIPAECKRKYVDLDDIPKVTGNFLTRKPARLAFDSKLKGN